MELFSIELAWADIIGFFGALLILMGFYRTSIGRWKTTSFWYELDNLAGSILLATYHILTETYVVLPLNVLWAIVALKGMTSYGDRKRQRAKKLGRL